MIHDAAFEPLDNKWSIPTPTT